MATLQRFAFLLICVICVSTVARAQAARRQSTHGLKTIRALSIQEGVVVDGSLDEAVWREAPAASGFAQKEPNEGTPATERTEFRIAYTKSTLYIGVVCYDSDPAAILATERRRCSNVTCWMADRTSMLSSRGTRFSSDR